jgi:hypothetical protein
MLYQNNSKAMIHFLLLASMIVGIGMADSSKDKDECTAQLTGLASCIPYVEGQAKTPAPDCCGGLKTLLKTNKKCLCLIIKDRNDPDLGGIVINVTLALNLPTVCNSPVNISKCPGKVFIMKLCNFLFKLLYITTSDHIFFSGQVV